MCIQSSNWICFSLSFVISSFLPSLPLSFSLSLCPPLFVSLIRFLSRCSRRSTTPLESCNYFHSPLQRRRPRCVNTRACIIHSTSPAPRRDLPRLFIPRRLNIIRPQIKSSIIKYTEQLPRDKPPCGVATSPRNWLLHFCPERKIERKSRGMPPPRVSSATSCIREVSANRKAEPIFAKRQKLRSINLLPEALRFLTCVRRRRRAPYTHIIIAKCVFSGICKK